MEPQYPYSPSNNFSVVVNTSQQGTDTRLLLLIEARKKSGWLAAFLNLFLPGAGYAYCGRWFLAIVVFLFIILVIVTSYGLLGWAFTPILFIDGFLCAGRYNREMTERVLRENRAR